MTAEKKLCFGFFEQNSSSRDELEACFQNNPIILSPPIAPVLRPEINPSVQTRYIRFSGRAARVNLSQLFDPYEIIITGDATALAIPQIYAIKAKTTRILENICTPVDGLPNHKTCLFARACGSTPSKKNPPAPKALNERRLEIMATHREDIRKSA